MPKVKVLFILKKRKLYSVNSKLIHSGLYNSATFVNDMLVRNRVDSHLVQVEDNNCIDREVKKYNPTHVFIEALWVVPEKFEILHKLYPNVKWIIRLHSEIPFIANEGVAMDWIFKYSDMGEKYNIFIAPNTLKMFNDLNSIGIKNLIYLPNYYPVRKQKSFKHINRDYINIGCFGAIRPMKNQLIQAVAAIKFGNDIGKTIHFHINVGRVERGENALKNIRALFDNQERHVLVEHTWYDHEDFKNLISRMDLGLQVSMNETFNIVAADFVSQNVPLVGSNEISWLSCMYKANPTSTDDMVKKLKFAYYLKGFNVQKLNKLGLKAVSKTAKGFWLNYFKNAK
jgi:hypothetical protein